ncbi:hypothetical protein BN8_02041 [Fibrisoma limi BUZ 3]|uniref:Activator of Hsp90 ATPase 1 family protein n=1 Tax=Fibrisoma limi BUZ 3 TaxID=1185876 RepID=I2GGG6_9BACT|nr:SRPBCC family protein [Fibrisoma limi]CCH52991.1 hypothetical protein BN8_02041 [Fibrisoma limi BUZ 3]
MMNNKDFNAERVSKTATFIINASVDTVFPLFGAFEERKWAEGWEPTLIYPSAEVIEEGTTFRTKAYDPEEVDYVWRVNQFDPAAYLIQYLIFTPNRYWTITVRCAPVRDGQTQTHVTYTYLGVNQLGNQLNKQSLDRMYANNLNDWAEAIHLYLLESGETN